MLLLCIRNFLFLNCPSCWWWMRSAVPPFGLLQEQKLPWIMFAVWPELNTDPLYLFPWGTISNHTPTFVLLLSVLQSFLRDKSTESLLLGYSVLQHWVSSENRVKIFPKLSCFCCVREALSGDLQKMLQRSLSNSVGSTFHVPTPGCAYRKISLMIKILPEKVTSLIFLRQCVKLL